MKSREEYRTYCAKALHAAGIVGSDQYSEIVILIPRILRHKYITQTILDKIDAYIDSNPMPYPMTPEQIKQACTAMDIGTELEELVGEPENDTMTIDMIKSMSNATLAKMVAGAYAESLTVDEDRSVLHNTYYQLRVREVYMGLKEEAESRGIKVEVIEV